LSFNKSKIETAIREWRCVASPLVAETKGLVMEKRGKVLAVGLGVLAVGLGVFFVAILGIVSVYAISPSRSVDGTGDRVGGTGVDEMLMPTTLSTERGTESERMPKSSEDAAEQIETSDSDIPAVLDSAEGLERFVGWLRTLSDDELLLLSNAEFDFKGSEIIDLLHAASGEWLVPALGGLAVSEPNELLKAILVEGLCGGFQFERVDDTRLIPVIEELLGQLSFQETDPYDVGRDVISTTMSAALRQGLDYVGLVERHLAESDNPRMLIHGYAMMEMFPGSETLLLQMTTSHPSPDGRMGALEGVRGAGLNGGLTPEEVTEVAILALVDEDSGRNQLLLMEMMGAAGGDSGVDALVSMMLDVDSGLASNAAQLLALKLEPERALGLLEQALTSNAIDEDSKIALFSAMGSLPDGLGVPLLLDVVSDPSRSTAERLAGLQGLWSAELNDELASRLADVLNDSTDAALRTEALRILSSGEIGLSQENLRELASLDSDPGVRAEAVIQASMQTGADSKEWLEQRLWEDDSDDVKAAALGALVMQAHFTGGGEAALSYLALAQTLTDDPGVLSMIESGRRLVNDFDPRRLELDLAEDSRFFSTMAAMTSGATSRGFSRRARQVNRFVLALRASR